MSILNEIEKDTVKLEHGFTIAWQDIKGAATVAGNYLSSHETQINAVTAEVTAAADTIIPAAAPAFNALSQIEVALVAKLATALQTAGNETTVAALLGDLWPAFESIVGTLTGHGAVQAALSSGAVAK